METTPSYTEHEIKEARKTLWKMGELRWKLDVTQNSLYDFYHSKEDITIVINCSRRLGKSYLLTIIAIEFCLKNPDSIIKFLQPEQKMLRTNLRPIMDKIFLDCPDELRPQFKTQDNIYVFPNGSRIQLAGTDNGNHEKLRGGDSHLCIIDEAGFCTDLKYIINSILIPTTTLTKGRIILSSTTPPNPDHEFIKYLDYAALEGTLIVKTIMDAVEDNKNESNPRITMSEVDRIIRGIPGGKDSQEFKTEYMCQRMQDSDRAVIPEFTEDTAKDIVMKWPMPGFCHKFVAMDIGYRDLTVVLFAYYDFENAITVIQDEIVINGPKMTTQYLAELIVKKEQELWTNKLSGELEEPMLRVCDVNPHLINDLQMLHGITFIPTRKDDRDQQINNLRMEIASRKLIIDPKCKVLINHLLAAVWDKNRKDLARSVDNGHYDAVMAAVYLVRNVDKQSSPFPKGYRHRHLGAPSELFYNPYYQDHDEKYDQFKNMFTPKTTLGRFKKK